MNHLKSLLGFLILFALSGCLQPPVEVGDDPMAARTLENKPVENVSELLPVAVVTPSNGWWTGSQNVGSEMPFSPDSQNRQTILSLPEIGAPEEWTVSLYSKYPTPAGANLANFRVTAVINFGAGGSTQIVEMDWLNGAQITLPCNALNVIAKYSNSQGTADLRLGVQVARGRRGGNQPPRLTISDLTVIDPSTSSDFVIPAYASRMHIIPGNVPSAAVLYNATTHIFTLSSPAGGTFNVSTVLGDNLLATDGVAVNGAARVLRVSNTDAVNTLSVTVFADLFG